jgi:hypothetical protein
MTQINTEELIEKITNKEKESAQFVKKYETRNMIELQKYYEGANWAFKYMLTVLDEES